MRILMCLVILMTAVQGWARERELVPVLSLDGYTVFESGLIDPQPGTLREYGEASGPPDRSGWITFLHAADFCYIGCVDEYVADCIAMSRGGVQYLALVRFEVVEPFWGIDTHHHVGEMHLMNEGRCISYSNRYPKPPENGDAFFVLGSVDKTGRTKIRDPLLLEHVDGAWLDTMGDPLAVPELFDLVDIIVEKRSIPKVLVSADCVATAQALYSAGQGWERTTYMRVELTHAGFDLVGPIAVRQVSSGPTSDPVAWTHPPRLDPGARYLVALEQDEDGAYACVNGFLGAWRIDGDDLLTRHGLRVGSYAEALAHAATLNKPHRPRHHPHTAPEG